MSLMNLVSEAAALPHAWRSRVLGRVGQANVKVLRMDAMPLEEERHPYDEALLVLEGHMELTVPEASVTVRTGELYLVPAGTPHSVKEGSRGTLVIIDL
ncbi:cupin domain-containing protein [Pyxidicoccus fallax]|uniref:Cupin domain-containing protein n=1 Tax=Pyxidicoccus fallax TaxID=394095 RepID=A0A848L9T9_9BACT|nr:cupin domain-containing protein [Pyxidicoccus fallax]NMO15629.1 cupin domain-containing protein [Pyxidicoccus fallax]NPC77226.1 cupin domain-containing protein [Pyxidicoccus fallax]